MAVSRNQKKTQARKRPGSARKARGKVLRSERGGRRRWLVVTLLLGLVGMAAYAFGSGGMRNRFGGEAPPLDEIDDVSRLRLENLLREAEADPAAAQ